MVVRPSSPIRASLRAAAAEVVETHCGEPRRSMGIADGRVELRSGSGALRSSLRSAYSRPSSKASSCGALSTPTRLCLSDPPLVFGSNQAAHSPAPT